MIRFFILLAAFAIAPIVAGHGVAPFALVLLPLRPPEHWQVLGWFAIATLLSSGKLTQPGTVQRALVSLVGMALLCASWLMAVLHINTFNAEAEQASALETMLWLSAPFQVAFAVVLVIVVIDLKQALQARHGKR